jgi:hypothetical protein
MVTVGIPHAKPVVNVLAPRQLARADRLQPLDVVRPLPETYDQPTAHAFAAEVALTPFWTFPSESPGAALGDF